MRPVLVTARLACGFVGAVVAVGCTAEIADTGSAGASRPTGAPRGAGPAPGSGGPASPGGTTPAPGTPVPGPAGAGGAAGSGSGKACATGLDPGPVFLRRMTHAEYRRAVRDLTGVAADVTLDFTPENAINGYRNNAEGISASTLQTERYGEATAKVASEIIGTAALRGQWLPATCTLTGAPRADCLTEFVKKFGERAFRRPLTTDEIARYTRLGDQALGDPNPYMAVSLVVRAMLQSPKFLYRVEFGAGGVDPARTGWKKLDGYEIATRLSFLVWGTVPDAALMAAAAAKRLDTADGVRAMATELLKNEARSKDNARDFYNQWFGFEALPHIDRDPMAFPTFTEPLRAAMADEARLFVDHVLWTPGTSFLELLDARYSFLNATLGTHYKKPVPAGAQLTRVMFDDKDERGGLLGLGSIMSVTWKADIEPILRGKYVREGLLCQHPPPPPPDVGPLPKAMPNESERQRLARHRGDPTCAVCHTLFDPIGFGLERYSAIGALRTMDSQGHPLTAVGRVEGFDKPDFVGMRGLAAKIAESPLFPACGVIQAFRYTFGRSELDSDACALQQLGDAFKASGYRYPDLIVAMVGSDAFRYRRADAGEKP